ncbi:hypothetical protein [Thermogemmatispora sp.]|uniref:hypothetical protein n=1 Tax=Thermogemmatispora sp. TaxID=1968838 RepID=UPI0035E40217
MFLLTCLAIVSAGAGALAATLYWRNQERAQPAATSVPSYTADDILKDFIAAGAHPFAIEYNTTISEWTDGIFSTAVAASSSVTFADASGCLGPCDPRNMGLWVYQDNTTADQAFHEVSQENSQALLHPPQVLSPVPTTLLLHARCLLPGAESTSIYREVVRQHCK